MPFLSLCLNFAFTCPASEDFPKYHYFCVECENCPPLRIFWVDLFSLVPTMAYLLRRLPFQMLFWLFPPVFF